MNLLAVMATTPKGEIWNEKIRPAEQTQGLINAYFIRRRLKVMSGWVSLPTAMYCGRGSGIALAIATTGSTVNGVEVGQRPFGFYWYVVLLYTLFQLL